LDGERRKDLEKRKAEEAAPLTDEEEARAKENWRTLKASMPWCAEFLAALAARSDFNGRRVLANMTITPRADKGEDGTP
jgi:hypothetical protein